MRGLIGGDCHARRYRLSTGARAGRLPVSDLDYVVCTDSVPVQQERHDLRFPGLGQRKEVPCLCGGVTALHKIRSYNNYNTYRQPAFLVHRRSMSFDYRVRPRRTRGGKEQAEQELTIGKRACHLLQAVLRYDFPCSAAMSGGFLSGIGNPSYEYRLRRVAFRLLVLLWDQGRR